MDFTNLPTIPEEEPRKSEEPDYPIDLPDRNVSRLSLASTINHPSLYRCSLHKTRPGKKPEFPHPKNFSEINWNEYEWHVCKCPPKPKLKMSRFFSNPPVDEETGKDHLKQGSVKILIPWLGNAWGVTIPERILKSGGEAIACCNLIRELWDARGRLPEILPVFRYALADMKWWELLTDLRLEAYKMVDCDSFPNDVFISHGLRRYLAVRKLSQLINPGLTVRNLEALVYCAVVGPNVYLKPSEHHRSSSEWSDYWMTTLESHRSIDPADAHSENSGGNGSPQTAAALRDLAWVSAERYRWFFGGLSKLHKQKFTKSKVERFLELLLEAMEPGEHFNKPVDV